MLLNHERLMRMYGQAKREGPHAVDKWVTIVTEFIGAQDRALRDARAGLVEAMAQASRDKAEIERLKQVCDCGVVCKVHPDWLTQDREIKQLRAALLAWYEACDEKERRWAMELTVPLKDSLRGAFAGEPK
jgi:hypothetical protein